MISKYVRKTAFERSNLSRLAAEEAKRSAGIYLNWNEGDRGFAKTSQHTERDWQTKKPLVWPIVEHTPRKAHCVFVANVSPDKMRPVHRSNTKTCPSVHCVLVCKLLIIFGQPGHLCTLGTTRLGAPRQYKAKILVDGRQGTVVNERSKYFVKGVRLD